MLKYRHIDSASFGVRRAVAERLPSQNVSKGSQVDPSLTHFEGGIVFRVEGPALSLSAL